MKRRLGVGISIVATALLVGYVFAQNAAKTEDMRSEALKEAHRTVWKEMKEAAQQGKSRCCTKWPCTQCILSKGACSCIADLKAGKAICHECKGAWEAGDGAIPDVKPSDVKVQPRERIRPPE